MSAGIQITGINELIEQFRRIGEKETINVIRQSIHAQASKTAKEIKSAAPVLTEFDEVNKKGKSVRKKGVLKNAIGAKRRRSKNNRFVSDVQITEGKSAKYDAWYWHFVEYGTLKTQAVNFVEPPKMRAKATTETEIKAEFLRRIEKKLRDASR